MLGDYFKTILKLNLGGHMHSYRTELDAIKARAKGLSTFWKRQYLWAKAARIKELCASIHAENVFGGQKPSNINWANVVNKKASRINWANVVNKPSNSFALDA